MRLSAVERKVLNCIQQEMPLESQPFKKLAGRVGIKECRLIDKIRDFKNKGIIRSFSAGISHRKLGFKSTLIALRVPLNNVNAVAREVVAYPEVTHCFLRNGEYNLWTVFIYRNGRLKQFLNNMSKRLGEENILNLPTQRQFKLKTGIRL